MNKKIMPMADVTPEILGQSQKGQDSLIQYVFEQIGTTDKYYVEFGAYDGVNMCNVWYLKNYKGWTGLLLDNKFEDLSINLHNRHITKDNICEIFHEFNVPKNHDFLCIDMDGIDYWVLKEVLKKYTPRVIMVETNVRFGVEESKVLKYDPNWEWDGRKWYGGSPYAFKSMLNMYDYIPVWIHVDDMIAIRRDVLEENGFEEPPWSYVYPGPNIALYNTHDRDHHTGKRSGPITQLDENEWQDI